MTYFLLQSEGRGNLDAEANTIRLILDAENEWDAGSPYSGGKQRYRYAKASLDMLTDTEHSSLQFRKFLSANPIPVGTVEFCQAAMRLQNSSVTIPALNVPAAFLKNESARRGLRHTVCKNADTEVLRSAIAKHKKVIVKPGDTPKRFSAAVVNAQNIEPFIGSHSGPFFVSEWIDDIETEWRVFFRKGEIMDLKNYSGNIWTIPRKETVLDMLRIWSVDESGEDPMPPAGTLDVAVLGTGETVLIEAHPLIACGLYGYEGRELPRMYRDTWEFYRSGERLRETT